MSSEFWRSLTKSLLASLEAGVARDINMHVRPRYAAIGAAAAASLVRAYDSDTILRAVTGACTLISPGPKELAVQGALIRNAWPAAGAWCGKMSAEWASCGIGGLAESPHDVFGVVLGGELRAPTLTDWLGSDWAILDGYTKIHACCQQTSLRLKPYWGRRSPARSGWRGSRKSSSRRTLWPCRSRTTICRRPLPEVLAAACDRDGDGARSRRR